MSDEDLRTLLRTEVLADEPPFGMTSATAVRAGQRKVRRRRVIVGAGSAAAVLAIGIGAVTLWPSERAGTRTSDIPPAAQEVLDEFDRATFPDLVDGEIRGVVGDAIPPDVEGRVEPRLDSWTRLRPEHYAHTDSWAAEYALSPSDQLFVFLRHDQSTNEGSARRHCRDNLDAGDMERCTVEVLGDGSVAITSVFKMRESRRGFTVPRANDDPGLWWYTRQVVHRRDYGFGVIARERVKAPTLDEADEMWSIAPEQLSAVATSPRLVYETPTPPEGCESPTFLMPKNGEGFARIRCREPSYD
ncbi:hypothetical protein HNR19_003222 [Nocardioides thalensis]|uniref:Uncharacterized protein n=1 Tax=Nocardioides thalensis TaxID=1914755 RepID=A0A853C4Y3_9ACTN|nr:hypothetical protein [Nocardioides thalensis]NYJ02524.1 hypothetical protein [Nocardioides thalensis]